METVSIKTKEAPKTAKKKGVEFEGVDSTPGVETKDRVKAKKKDANKVGLIDRLRSIGTISNTEVVEFTRHFSVMLSAGVTIFEALQFLKSNSRNSAFRFRLERIIEMLNNGRSLSSSMREFPKVFPSIYVNIIAVGEKSGTLANTMTDLADHMEENEKFKSRVKGALIYPKIIGVVMVAFVLVLALFVMPRISTIFVSLGAEIPFTMRIIINSTDFLRNNVLIFILGLVGALFGIYALFKNPVLKKLRDRSYLSIPFFGDTITNYNVAQTSQHFGTLLDSGLTILQSLEITRTVINNSVYAHEIAFVIDKIRNGSALSQSFPDQSAFPTMFTKMIKVGERTGKLPQVIRYMQSYYSGLVGNDVKNITATVEPLIMLVLGFLVAGLVVTVIGPIYTLISDIGDV